ncbi:hypothetical protein A0H76_2831 [Hepatospora eriocheir]|uniref:Uncharacterized protein n=1 Tax=Hepatospora eriocheir TaxID=1081669 RepID=A0A1X0QL94_9MICR|nr:hypothetical protein A0H76_2831 [Hepatospora eriocheir]
MTVSNSEINEEKSVKLESENDHFIEEFKNLVNSELEVFNKRKKDKIYEMNLSELKDNVLEITYNQMLKHLSIYFIFKFETGIKEYAIKRFKYFKFHNIYKHLLGYDFLFKYCNGFFDKDHERINFFRMFKEKYDQLSKDINLKNKMKSSKLIMDFIKDNNFQIDEYISNNSFIKKHIYSYYSLRLSLCKFFIKEFSNNHVFSYYFTLFNNCHKLGYMIKKRILDLSNLDLSDSNHIVMFF